MKEKVRLDQLLVEKGLAENRSKAQSLIRLGWVMAGGKVVEKPGSLIGKDSELVIKPAPKYVSRGGIKLESALRAFGVLVENKVCLDIGASTGGFTDCLLQNGAKKVYALDVGKGLIDQRLRDDPRVIIIEKFNARYLSREIIPEQIELLSIDVSFISLSLILASAKSVLKPNAEVLALVKPQFELEPKLVKKGVVRDSELQLKAVQKVREFAEKIGFRSLGQTQAGIKGQKGNQEFFLYLILKET